MISEPVSSLIGKLQLEPLLDELQSSFGDALLGIVLYGSHAREAARPHSDIDLLVIAADLPQRRSARAELFLSLQFEAGYPYPIASILGKTQDEFERLFPSLYLDIGVDGIVLYDSQDYVTTKLSRIRSLIQEAGLRRRRLDGEFIWEFSRTVRPAEWSLGWDGYRERMG